MSTNDDFEIVKIGSDSDGEELFVVRRKETGVLAVMSFGNSEWAEDALFLAGDQWSAEQRERLAEPTP
jgi:hypothetical protein